MRVRTECKVVMNEVAESWRKMLVDLCGRISAGCIDWHSRGEDILDVAQKVLCLQILKNLGYKTLAGLATMVLNMARVAKRYDIFDVAFVESCFQHARRGLAMVSLMFTLFQINVAWPKLKGARSQEMSRQELIKQHESSDFAESFSCLPMNVQTHVKEFGVPESQLVT